MSTRPTVAQVLLCVVQAYERLVSCAMLPLLVLFLHDRHGFQTPAAQLILNVFIGLTHLSGLPGGMLADRKIGATVGLITGSALLAAGYGALAIDSNLSLWLGCGLMVLGWGLFRPSELMLLGALFPRSHARHERGFLCQYLAVQVAYILSWLLPQTAAADARRQMLFLLGAAAMLVAALVLALAARLLPSLNQRRDKDTVSPAASTDRDPANRRSAIWLLCGLAVVFGVTANQSSGSLALFGYVHTGQSSAMLPRDGLELLQDLLIFVLLLLSIAGAAWFRRRDAEPSTPLKMMWGFVATTAAFILLTTACLLGGDTARVSPAWLIGGYVLLCLAQVLIGPYVLSLATRMALPNRSGQTVGLLMTMVAVSRLATDGLALQWGRWPNHRYFGLLALASLAAAVSLFSWRRRLQDLADRC